MLYVGGKNPWQVVLRDVVEKEKKSTPLPPRKRRRAPTRLKMLKISIPFCFDVLQQNKLKRDEECRILWAQRHLNPINIPEPTQPEGHCSLKRNNQLQLPAAVGRKEKAALLHQLKPKITAGETAISGTPCMPIEMGKRFWKQWLQCFFACKQVHVFVNKH